MHVIVRNCQSPSAKDKSPTVRHAAMASAAHACHAAIHLCLRTGNKSELLDDLSCLALLLHACFTHASENALQATTHQSPSKVAPAVATSQPSPEAWVAGLLCCFLPHVRAHSCFSTGEASAGQQAAAQQKVLHAKTMQWVSRSAAAWCPCQTLQCSDLAQQRRHSAAPR